MNNMQKLTDALADAIVIALHDGLPLRTEACGEPDLLISEDGFEISRLYRSDTDASYHFTKAQSEAMDDRYTYMWNLFAKDHLGKDSAEGINFDDLTVEQAEKFQDYENDFFEPALLRISAFVAADTVTVEAAVNYMDAPYYRATSDDVMFSKTYTAEEFGATSTADIVALVVKSIVEA